MLTTSGLSLLMQILGAQHFPLNQHSSAHRTLSHGGTSAVMKLVKLFVESVGLLLEQNEAVSYFTNRALLPSISRTSCTAARRYNPTRHLLFPSLIRLKCGHLGGKVLVPTSTHISRLIASRFQTDLMKSTMLLIARTDSESAKLISSTVDAADHEFILGVTKTDSQPLAQAIAEAEAAGATGAEIDRLEAKWMEEHPLCTFNQGE